MSNTTSTTGQSLKNVTSVSNNGERIAIDTNAAKADFRDEQNRDLTNIANNRVRPWCGRIRGATPVYR